MIQPKFGKQGKMKGPWHRRLTNYKRHFFYGGAAAAGVLAAHLTHHEPSLAEGYARHYASSPEYGERAARILRADARRDLPGPRSPAFYGHRYSHLLPRGAYQTAMRQGTPQQQAAAR